MVSNRDSPLQSPASRTSRGTVRRQATASSPLKSPGQRRRSPLQSPLQRGETLGLAPVPGELAEETSSVMSRSLNAGDPGDLDAEQQLLQRGVSEELEGMEWDDTNFEDKQEAESELPASAGSVTIHHSSFQSDASSVSSLCVCRACYVLVLLMITPMKTIEAALARR